MLYYSNKISYKLRIPDEGGQLQITWPATKRKTAADTTITDIAYS